MRKGLREMGMATQQEKAVKEEKDAKEVEQGKAKWLAGGVVRTAPGRGGSG